MKKLGLAAAIGHIKQAFEGALAPPRNSPFFFLVGSGISSPQVPLASKIEEDCKVRALARQRSGEPRGPRAIDTYSHWFDQAFPHALERQRYLRSLIEGQSISHANFRLAHLLMVKGFASLVVTTNFDDFLSRALDLFGKPHIVCDHPRTVERIDPEADDIQIVHVHGSYWFYDCCNLAGEIETRSRGSADGSSTMASLLDTVLARRAPLVLGYAGWPGDVVMCALERRLRNPLPLPYNLYWFCYRESEAAGLPEIVREHPNVYIVTADRAAPSDPSLAPAFEDTPAVLPAQKVLDELIRALNLAAPDLTRDPLLYFAELLKRSLPRQDGLSAEGDIYSLASVIERIEAARGKTSAKTARSEMEQVRDYLRRSRYRDAIHSGAKMANVKLSVKDSRELLGAMLSAAWRLDDSSADEVLGYDLVIRLGEGSKDTYVRERVAMALVNKGLALTNANRHTEALEIFKDVERRYRSDRDLFFRKQVAEALFNFGYTLGAMGSHKRAADAYAVAARRLEKSPEPELQEMCCMALLNEGCEYGELGQPKQELAAYEKILRRFRKSDDADIQLHVAQALYNKGVTLSDLKRSKPAAAAFQELAKRFELSRNRELRDLAESARARLDGPEPDA